MIEVCPPSDRFAALIDGKLGAAEKAALHDHVGSCEPCQTLLTGLARSGTEAPLAFCAGDLVASRYRVVRFIARGGMGEVYEAEDGELGVRVALKTIAAERARHGEALDRFRREIRLARGITHPNVCRIFDVGFHDTRAFFTMELLEGETLAQHLRRRGRFSPEEALPILRQIAAGLDAAHHAGVIHRDFKCQNVTLVAAGSGLRAVITDFGLARPSVPKDGISVDGTLLGSPAYMAPEQVEGRAVTAACDVYAFGVVLFELLTGRVPFRGSTVFATAAKRLTEPPPSVRPLAPDVSPAREQVILRCLARRPADRFASCGAAVAAFGAGRGPVRRSWPALAAALVLALAPMGVRQLVSRSAHAASPSNPPRIREGVVPPWRPDAERIVVVGGACTGVAISPRWVLADAACVGGAETPAVDGIAAALGRDQAVDEVERFGGFALLHLQAPLSPFAVRSVIPFQLGLGDGEPVHCYAWNGSALVDSAFVAGESELLPLAGDAEPDGPCFAPERDDGPGSLVGIGPLALRDADDWIADVTSDEIVDVSATYGANLGAPHGNATWSTAAGLEARSPAALLDGREGGRFGVEIEALGDPYPGDIKDFRLEWRCGRDESVFGLYLPPDSNHRIAYATCPASHERGQPIAVAPGALEIRSATYGGNCGAREGNQSERLAAACDGKIDCVQSLDALPAVATRRGCGPLTYDVRYRCGSGPLRALTIAPESTPAVELRCGIEVVGATYGGNCGAAPGNQTPALAKACDGVAECDYTVDYQAIGDPAPGCRKDYRAEFRCGRERAVHSIVVPAEAGLKNTLALRCP